MTGDPECPPCPPHLKRYYELSLVGEDNKLQKGGGFAYLDRKAPMNKDAFYQVELVDASGRESRISNLAHSPRVTPPSKPTGLKAESGDGVVKLAWNGLAISKKLLEKTGCKAGWCTGATAMMKSFWWAVPCGCRNWPIEPCKTV